MFPLLLILGAACGILLPAPETFQGMLDRLVELLIALVFLLQGLRLKPGAITDALRDWSVQGRILLLSFVAFPCLGILIDLSARAILPGMLFPSLLATGFVFLCCLPSTVQSSVAMTAIAHGNMAVSIASSALSSICGVIFTPLLMWLIAKTGIFTLHTGLDPELMGKIFIRLGYELLLPFGIGRLLAPTLGPKLNGLHWLKFWDRAAIVMMVYSVFCGATHHHLWAQISWTSLLVLLVLENVLLASILCVSWIVGGWGGSTRPTRIAVQFCGSKKALSFAVPLCTVLAGGNAGALLVPVMLYHQLQLFVTSFFAHHYARTTIAED